MRYKLIFVRKFLRLLIDTFIRKPVVKRPDTKSFSPFESALQKCATSGGYNINKNKPSACLIIFYYNAETDFSCTVGATKKGVLRNSFLCFMQLFLTLINETLGPDEKNTSLPQR